MILWHNTIWLLLTLCLYFASTRASGPHFEQFYPQLRPYMQAYLQDECRTEYHKYLNDSPSSSNQLSCKNCTAAPLTGCLLHTFREVDKANMVSAAVILGILPTSLSLAGSMTAETGLLSLRRPVLAFLLVAAAPAVNPTRTFNYGGPYVLMTMRRRGLKGPQIRGVRGVAVLVLEYAFTPAAVTNLGIVSWRLCVRAICSFAQDTVYMPALWAFFAAAIHVGGATAVALRVRFVERTKDGPLPGTRTMENSQAGVPTDSEPRSRGHRSS
jgi:hypothetical protein